MTFLGTEHDTVTPASSDCKRRRVLVDGVIMPKRAGVLSVNIQFNTKRTKRLAGNAVSVNGCNDIRSRFVNSAVNHESGSIDRMHIPPLNNLALLIDKDEIRHFNVLKVFEHGVNPEVVRFDRIADRNVTGRALVAEALLAQISESLRSIGSLKRYRSHMFLPVLPFFFESSKLGPH